MSKKAIEERLVDQTLALLVKHRKVFGPNGTTTAEHVTVGSHDNVVRQLTRVKNEGDILEDED